MSTSIADVECKHALSKHWSDRPFPTIVAKHLNQEFGCMKRDAVLEAESWCKSLSGISDASAKASQGAKKGPLVTKMRAPQIRRKPAYMYFRDDWILSQKSLKGSDAKVNPASKEFWVELKEAFSQLNPNMRAYYEELATESGAEAARKRALDGSSVKDQIETESSSLQVALANQDSSLPLVLQGGDQDGLHVALPLNPWLAEASVMEQQTDLDIMSEMTKNVLNEMLSTKVDLLGDNNQHPISESLLESSWRSNVAHGITWAQALSRFDQEAQRFVRPPPGFAFPRQVQYQGHCGSFCRFHNDILVVSFFRRLLRAMQEVVEWSGEGIGRAAQENILLQFQVIDGISRDVHDVHAWLVAPSAASGPHSASQAFILCRRVEIEDVEGNRSDTDLERGSFFLDLEALPFLESTVEHASNLLPSGPLEQLSEEEFAERLFRTFEATAALPDEIAIRRLDFDDVSLRRVRVTRYSPEFEPIRVLMHEVENGEEEEEEEIGEVVEDDSDQPPIGASEEAAVPDLLSLVLDDEPSKTQTRSKKSSKPKPLQMTSTRLRKHVVDEAYQGAEGPSFPAEVDLDNSEMQQQLRRAVGHVSKF